LIRIEVADMQDELAVKGSEIKKIVKNVLKREKIQNAEISIALVDNERIAQINKRYREDSDPTDVLSFLLEENIDGKGTMLADVIASCEMAKTNARKLRISPQAEIMNYIVHGLLHVLGYDDDTIKSRNKMNKLQRAVLEHFGYHLE